MEAKAGMGCQHTASVEAVPGASTQAERLAVLVAGRSSNTHQHMETTSGPSIRTPANVPGLLMATDLTPEDTKTLCKQGFTE